MYDQRCLPLSASQRADGTMRPQMKVKPGFVPQEEAPLYIAPHRVTQTVSLNSYVENLTKSRSFSSLRIICSTEASER